MKWVAFILLGFVLLAAICGVVLWANMPTAKLTVQAVRPMGTNAFWVPLPAEASQWPVWEVAITNNGRAPANWHISLLAKDSRSTTDVLVGPGRVRPRGTLSPGQWTNVYMPLPSDSAYAWHAGIRYETLTGPLEQKLSSWLKPIPMLHNLLPNHGARFAYDTWHVGTNVVTAR